MLRFQLRWPLLLVLALFLSACQPLLLSTPTPMPLVEKPSPFAPLAYGNLEALQVDNEAILESITEMSPEKRPWVEMDFESRYEQSMTWFEESQFGKKYAHARTVVPALRPEGAVWMMMGNETCIEVVNDALAHELGRFQNPNLILWAICFDQLIAGSVIEQTTDFGDEQDSGVDLLARQPTVWLDDPDYAHRLERLSALPPDFRDLLVIGLADCTTMARQGVLKACPGCYDVDRTAYAVCLHRLSNESFINEVMAPYLEQ